MAKKSRLQAPQGMHDVLGEDQPYFTRIWDAVNEIARFYAFSKIDTPLVEYSELY